MLLGDCSVLTVGFFGQETVDFLVFAQSVCPQSV